MRRCQLGVSAGWLRGSEGSRGYVRHDALVRVFVGWVFLVGVRGGSVFRSVRGVQDSGPMVMLKDKTSISCNVPKVNILTGRLGGFFGSGPCCSATAGSIIDSFVGLLSSNMNLRTTLLSIGIPRVIRTSVMGVI